ncbi:MAG: deoxyribonuclease IV [Mollicutes bacterium]|nr:deoxyribonuclease IV [Mollicutes bacterium]
MIIGSHVSFNREKQLLGCVQETLSYGANAFMIYTGAPQNTLRSNIDDSLTESAYKLMKENSISLNNVVVHAPYIINLANMKNFDFNVSFLSEELNRCQKLGIKKIIIHPGNHLGLGEEEGIKNVALTLNKVLETDKTDVYLCLETMSGKGSEVGKTFSELKSIINQVNKSERLLICLDSCHLNDAGYDMNDFDLILNDIDKIIGISKIGCFHINDSKNERGESKDRHANFGLGTIGFDNLIKMIYHPKLREVPKILETPYVVDLEDNNHSFPPYKYEIEMIKNKKFNQNLLEDIRNQ